MLQAGFACLKNISEWLPLWRAAGERQCVRKAEKTLCEACWCESSGVRSCIQLERLLNHPVPGAKRETTPFTNLCLFLLLPCKYQSGPPQLLVSLCLKGSEISCGLGKRLKCNWGLRRRGCWEGGPAMPRISPQPPLVNWFVLQEVLCNLSCADSGFGFFPTEK